MDPGQGVGHALRADVHDIVDEDELCAYPDVKVVSYAYTFTDTPPKLELEDNIVIVYALLYEDARELLNTTSESNPNYAYNAKLQA